MVRSPKGLIDVEPADQHEPALEALESNIQAVEAWANDILKNAEIELKPGRALQQASLRKHADAVFWALTSIHHAGLIRGTLKLAKLKGDDAHRDAIFLANRMWQFCGAAFTGKFALNEDSLFKGVKFTEGPKRPRRDKLAKLIDGALTKLGGNAKAAQVLDSIKTYVQEVEDDRTVWWQDERGREQKTTFKSFQNRVAERRKLFSK